MDVQQVCLNCMAVKGRQASCENCGIDDRNLLDQPQALPMRTLLQGKYLIGRLLGSGGFGNTYLALDMLLNQRLAIKEFLPQGLATRAHQQTDVIVYTGERKEQYTHGMEKFLEEARTLAKFQHHPGIVSVRDFFHANQTAYIVMEFVDGLTLKQFVQLRGGKISFHEALEIMTPVMDALREVHAAGVLHRDISPDNIYITKSKQVKLLDFGAARYAMADRKKSLSIILKPGYAPSEQYHSKGVQGPWSDVYATGATIYHVLTGVLPNESLERMDRDPLKNPSDLGADLPLRAERTLMKAMEPRSTDRIQSVDDLQMGLIGSGATRSEKSERVYFRFTKLRLKSLLLAAILLIGGLSSYWIYTQIQSNGINKDSVAVGAYIQFGSYNDTPILWRVVHLDDVGNPILLSNRIITIKAFDAKGPQYSDPIRINYGSNRYRYSTLRLWLNSTEGERGIKWPNNAPTAANLQGDNPYVNEKGFLADGNFSEAERAMIVPLRHEVLLAERDRTYSTAGSEGHLDTESLYDGIGNYEYVWREELEDRVFLLSLKQIYEYLYLNRDVLGDAYWLAKPTREAVLQSTYRSERLSAEKNWYYWTSTPNTTAGSFVRYVYVDETVQGLKKSGNGPVEEDRANSDGHGVRPALKIDGEFVKGGLSGMGTADEPFEIVGN
jgi:serine/threonine protein kinase